MRTKKEKVSVAFTLSEPEMIVLFRHNWLHQLGVIDRLCFFIPEGESEDFEEEEEEDEEDVVAEEDDDDDSADDEVSPELFCKIS